MKNLVADKPNGIIIHAGTNNNSNGINSLNSVKKIINNVKKNSQTRKLFSPVYYSEKIKGHF